MSEDFQIPTFVRRQIGSIIGRSPGNLRPTSRAMLAQLRQASSQEPGSVPSIWSVTSEGLPSWEGPRMDRLEASVHIALTLFAVHQQARSQPMQDVTKRFGGAVRTLCERNAPGGDPYETPVYRRLTALMTTTALPGIRAHLTGLITQMRSHDIAFDYGRLADDLFWAQTPGGAERVRRTWGRDFHRSTITSSTEGIN